MNEPKRDWRGTAKTIAVTAALTSAIWIVIAAYLMQRYGFDPVSAAPAVVATGAADNIASTAGSVTPRQASVENYPGQIRALLIPVIGVKPGDLVDTFTQARAGGTRVHDAIDIMADDGTPVVAAAAGTVEKLFFSDGGGGITAYVRSPDKAWMYYYAHLQAYAPGLREGMRIARGAPIGSVGHSGNADPGGPHLHFAINRMANGEGWWQGTPVNPYLLLTR